MVGVSASASASASGVGPKFASPSNIQSGTTTLPSSSPFLQPHNPPHQEPQRALPHHPINSNSNTCLFCPQPFPTPSKALQHMTSHHSFKIPYPENLIVDIETLVAYLHSIIFEYHECIFCGETRDSVQDVQGHMREEKHCGYDVHGEMGEFYGFEESAVDEETDEDDGEEVHDLNSSAQIARREFSTASPSPEQHHIALPSNRAALPRHQRQQPRNHLRNDTRSQSHTSTSPPRSSSLTHSSLSHQPLTKSESRALTLNTRLSTLRASDQLTLQHLPSSQQRAILSTQKRQVERAERAERRMIARVQGKGNKTGMKHFVSDVPGRKNG